MDKLRAQIQDVSDKVRSALGCWLDYSCLSHTPCNFRLTRIAQSGTARSAPCSTIRSACRMS